MRIYIKPDFREIIKEEREKRNWSITWPALMNIESGKAEKPLKSTLDKIGGALGISLYVIEFGDKTDKEMQTQPSNQNQIKETKTGTQTEPEL